MDDLIQFFRASCDEVASATKQNACAFRREKGINDFLIDASEQSWEPIEMACRCLTNCCTGSTIRDGIVCIVAANFLDTVLGNRPATEAQRTERLKECTELAFNSATYEQLHAWATKWFDP